MATISDETKRRIIRAAHTSPEIQHAALSQRFGISQQTIRIILKEAGVKLPNANKHRFR